MTRSPIARRGTGPGPLLATAIHAGAEMRPSLLPYCALTSSERLREEDPFTDRLAAFADNQLIGLRSRFEVDLNRSRDKAVYRVPADAWGLQLWRHPLPAVEVEASLEAYDHFYAMLGETVAAMLSRHPRIVVYDIHS